MADKDFERTIINPRERPLSSDINQAQSQLDWAIREVVMRSGGRRTPSSQLFAPGLGIGFMGDSFRVISTGTMELLVAPGVGFQGNVADLPTAIGGVVGLSDRCPLKPLVLSAFQSIFVPAADPSLPRVDIIEVRYDRRVENPLNRDVLDPGSGEFVPTNVDKTLSFALDLLTSVNGSAAINLKTGTPAASPVPPATSTGYTKVAEITVGAAVAGLTEDKLADLRTFWAQGGQLHLGAYVDHNISANTIIGNPYIACSPGVRCAARTITLDSKYAVEFYFWGGAEIGVGNTPIDVNVGNAAYNPGFTSVLKTGAASVIQAGLTATTATQTVISGCVPSGAVIGLRQPYKIVTVVPYLLNAGTPTQSVVDITNGILQVSVRSSVPLVGG